MKKIIALLLAVVCASVCFAGCDKASDESSATSGEKETLTIATSPDFPPFESLEGEEVVGIEVELVKLICADIGMDYEFVQIDFDSVLLGVQSGKYTCGMSGITVNDDRKENMLFTDPYYIAAQVIVVKEDSTIASKADLEGKTVSVQTGTTAEEGCGDAGIAVEAFAQNADAKAALTTGKVDAWVVDNLTAIQMVVEGDGLKILEENLTEEPYALAFAKGNEELVEKINASLKTLIDNGSVEKIFTDFGETYVKPE
ncbi:MAG: transporter substrate-binding domain-containing protein [Clostridia bacterium]|nr:transporter substrate-binding domain-containing protein [Clostridia bacterium]